MELDYPGDVLGFADALTDAERAKLALLRAHLDAHVRPLLIDAWERGETLEGIRAPLAALRLEDDPALLGPDGRPSALYQGFKTVELSRLDLGVSIIYGGQVGMFRTLVHEGGSPEQIAAWDADILAFRKTGCFALNEPDHGSDIAGGIATTARRVGEDWVLDGRKRWIGNATISDEICVIARRRTATASSRSLCPAMRRASSAVSSGARRRCVTCTTPTSFSGRYACRRARACRASRPFGTSTGPSARCVPRSRGTRWACSWALTTRHCANAKERSQFGAPIAGYQLIQEKLVQIVANLAQTLALAVRTTTHPVTDDVTPSLLKLVAADRLRESAALAREIVGGNGLLLENDVIRFLADAEAVYTFEGTREMNVLILGRALTGISAFTRG